jgi:triacylglycerol esterase/lipase EstA (alpha/beta hydrolase family)
VSKPILILDGIFGRPARFKALRRVLDATCGPTKIFHYNSTGFVPFETLAHRLATRIHELGQPVNVIGFSMGGIVIRTAKLIDPTLPIRSAALRSHANPHQLVEPVSR